MQARGETYVPEFNSMRISIASPDQIRSWSHGEVTKPETINYRTLRPEKDGLFCERIFGPTRDWECFCGKYKRRSFKGVICDRCGVEVTRAKVRRERMGHIELAAPVAHIWFSKGTPSRIGHLLDLSPRNLERVLYFAQYVIVSVDEGARKRALAEMQEKLQADIAKREQATQGKLEELRQALQGMESAEGDEADEQRQVIQKAIADIEERLAEEISILQRDYQDGMNELEDLRPMKLLSESRYRELRERFGGVFHGGMGAEAIQEILSKIELEELREKLTEEMRSSSGQRRRKAIKRLWVVDAFRASGTRPEWMVMTVLPVLPPELRPMVQLDGGRFATSDLNDLYRRVINRNNRLRRLLDLGAPDIIVRNEKRMLQEAVDALIDNGRRGRPIQGSHNHKLKSLSDLLRGKQGRFRQNLLGKRVDYSGRSVIVAGPELKLHQCGLPKRMALELFKPFVMNRLVVLGIAPNIKSAKRMVERSMPEVWDILEDVIRHRPVLLNRAPTLHRLGIQAFEPILIEGNAIQIHPLVCSAFNADFDGDQMAVHVPLSRMAVLEAQKVMLSTYNMLSPASGDPLVAPTLDMVLGCYYLTNYRQNGKGEGKRFISRDEARLAYDTGNVDLKAKILLKDTTQPDGWLETCVGRIILSEVLPPEMLAQIDIWNKVMDKGGLKKLAIDCYRALGNEGTAAVLDRVKELGFHYATLAGLTISISDIRVPKDKQRILANADAQVATLNDQYMMGLISEDERYIHAVDIWTRASDEMTKAVETELPHYGGVAIMARSGAKGNIGQIKQMAGMRGLMSNPKGRIIDLPIKSSFREGLTVLEYFISTHGARKGLADTALRTADSGYLTRRLVDVSQEIIILEEDCGILDDEHESEKGVWVTEPPQGALLASLEERLLGRYTAAPVMHPETGGVIVGIDEAIDEDRARAIIQAGIKKVYVRSPLTCKARRGLCQICYGRSPATGRKALMGEAIGVIAAQSIGEPGTQLTMRTFHTGGVAGADITSGLPRVEELFEARVPKGSSILSDIDGEVEVLEEPDGRLIRVVSREQYREDYALPPGYEVTVQNGEPVDPGMVLANPPTSGEGGNGSHPHEPITAGIAGRVELGTNKVTIVWEDEDPRESHVPASSRLLVKTEDHVRAGDALTEGPLNPHDVLRIKGKDEVQNYLKDEVQKVYRSQGVAINDRHIEVIVKQMLRRVQVESSGDTKFLPGQYVDKFEFYDENARCIAEGGEPATARPVLLGVTRASLQTDSFLSAASFQETTRVLTEAAVRGAEDHLLGLKENVIIGRLIPARLEISEEGRERLGKEELAALERRREPMWLGDGEAERLLGEEQFLAADEIGQADGFEVEEGGLGDIESLSLDEAVGEEEGQEDED